MIRYAHEVGIFLKLYQVGRNLFALACLALALMTLGGAQARVLTESEKSGLNIAIQAFEKAMRSNDYKGIFQAMPPRVMRYLAERGGQTEEELIESFAAVMQKTFETVSIVSFEMDETGADALARPDGESYIVVPTRTVLDVVGDKKYSVESQTLAIEDNGRWYLMRVSDPQQVVILVEVYPEFKNVKLPGDSWEALEEP